MRVNYADCMVLNARIAVSKSGNEWARIEFLDCVGLDTIEVFCFGESCELAKSLVKGSHVAMGFDLMPYRNQNNSGVRLVLKEVNKIG